MSLLDELHRRNVTRVAVGYAVSAWLIIQVAETIFPLFGFDETPARFIVILLAIGFIPALIIAWVYELTPEGLKKDREVDHDGAPAQRATQKTDRLIMLVLALAVTYFAVDKFLLSPDAMTTFAGDKSIAVLPFVNRSESADDAYFTDGMHDEILTRLAKISDLKVISRTSVMQFRDTDMTVPEIADELSVTTVLEGGVQRVGNQVRINVQLIDANNDVHLWSEIFDREMTNENLFAIQSDIAKSIANALHAELSPATLAEIESVPTQNAEAYDLYLRAVAERAEFQDIIETFTTIKPWLERAVALDPDFLDAQVFLAETYGRLLWSGADPDRVYRSRALELVTDIRRRWPDRVESRLALGHYYYTVERDYERALQEFDAVADALPNDMRALRARSGALKRLERYDEALEVVKQWIAIDPESSFAAAEEMLILRLSGRIEETLATIRRGREKFPDNADFENFDVYYTFILTGDAAPYLAYGERKRQNGTWGDMSNVYAFLRLGQGDIESALQHCDARSAGEYGPNHVFVDTDRALILRAAGRDEEAQVAADRALAYADGWVNEDRAIPSDEPRRWYRAAAYVAAIAGDVDKATAYRQLAESSPPNEYIHERQNDELAAVTDALLGDAEAGWSRLQPQLGPQNLTPARMAEDAYFRLFFEDVPDYQEFVAMAE